MEEKPASQTATPDVTFRGAALWFRNSAICPNTAFKHLLTLYIGFQRGYHEYSQLQKRKKKKNFPRIRFFFRLWDTAMQKL